MKPENTIYEDRVKMIESTSVYNPHYLIEIDGEPAIHVYIDAFASKAVAHNLASYIYYDLLAKWK